MQEWRLGSYELVRRLGEGGMAQVYLARDVRLGREVAIKVLDRHLAERPGFRERFLREARVAAALDHPNIVPLYDFGESGVLYLVMPYVSGGSLQDKLKRAPFPMGAVATYGSQIADALAYAHQRSVVHRDVKPANMLLHADGRVMLSDFGLAKIIDQANRVARPRNHPDAGTPEYMAPEQINGHSDERSDIYALGVVLYLLLAGRLPFTGSSSSAVMEGHLYRIPESPRRYNPAISAAMEAVVLRAMAKRPEDRFQRANELGAALLGALIVDDPVSQSGSSLRSRPSTPSYVYPPYPQQPPRRPLGPTGSYGPYGQTGQHAAAPRQDTAPTGLANLPNLPDVQQGQQGRPGPGYYDSPGWPDAPGYSQAREGRRTTRLPDLPDLPDLTHMDRSGSRAARPAQEENLSGLSTSEESKNSGELPRLDLAGRAGRTEPRRATQPPLRVQQGEAELQHPSVAPTPPTASSVTGPRQRAVAQSGASSGSSAIGHPIGRRTAHASLSTLPDVSRTSQRLPTPSGPHATNEHRAASDAATPDAPDASRASSATPPLPDAELGSYHPQTLGVDAFQQQDQQDQQDSHGSQAQQARPSRLTQTESPSQSAPMPPMPPMPPMSQMLPTGPLSSFPTGAPLGGPSQGGPTGRFGQMEQLDYFAQFGQQSTAPAFGASPYPSPASAGSSGRSASANSPLTFPSAPTLPGLAGKASAPMSEGTSSAGNALGAASSGLRAAGVQVNTPNMRMGNMGATESDPLLEQAYWRLTTLPGVDLQGAHAAHAGVVPPVSTALLPGTPTGAPAAPYVPPRAHRSMPRDTPYQSLKGAQQGRASAPMWAFITALLILLLLAAGILLHWLQVGGPLFIH